MQKTNVNPEPGNPEIVIRRIFNASPERMFRAWTDPNFVMKWWGPKNFTTPVCKIDLRVGGEIFYCMRSPEGENYWGKSIYKEIVKPERIVCTDSFADNEGNIVPASYYGMEGEWPLEFLLTFEFEEQGGQTKFTLTHHGVPAGQMSDSTMTGWTESFDKLAELLKSEKDEG